MRKFKFFLLAVTGAALLMLGGCKEKAKYDESAFQDDLEPLTDDELESMDENTDDEMTVADEDEMAQGDLEVDETKNKESSSDASTDSTESQKKLDEKGTYTDKDDVAEYIYEYGHVPSNLKAEIYDNADNMFPVEDGVTYQQCSLDTDGKQKIIFTQDGKRVYYTADDGESFEEIY
nr:ribonuclease domain-containing protein [uncultured Blautia sp.]